MIHPTSATSLPSRLLKVLLDPKIVIVLVLGVFSAIGLKAARRAKSMKGNQLWTSPGATNGKHNDDADD